jgi:hypothetical protein
LARLEPAESPISPLAGRSYRAACASPSATSTGSNEEGAMRITTLLHAARSALLDPFPDARVVGARAGAARTGVAPVVRDYPVARRSVPVRR